MSKISSHQSDGHAPLPRARARRHGPLAWFARNHVAANLLFFLLIVIGGLSVMQVKLEVFPKIEPPIVSVSVPYPGANPEEVEQGVLMRIEEAVAEVEGVKDVRSIAAEGQGVVRVEAQEQVDMDGFYDDVKAAMEGITTLPEQAEEPTVSQMDEKVQVMSLALYGDVSRRTLKETAERVKDDLEQTDAISQVAITGLPPYEISIEVDKATLREYGLTFEDVAQAVRSSSLDVPAGSIESDAARVLVRSTNQAYRGEEFEKIVVRRADDGTAVTVGDIAAVVDGFEDTDYFIEFNGEPAAVLLAYRIGEEGALNVAATINAYVERQEEMLPPGMYLTTYNDISIAFKSRIELMLKNGAFGLVLIVLLLGLFLDMRLAFWTAGGLAMSVVASLILLPMFDVSINMMSLFAYILVLGILVDDAIVVGENIHAHREMGKDRITASIDGVREVAVPVTMAILTTVVAFAPLLFASGVIGDFLSVIPIVVISVLMLSLVEALLVLPAHLAGSGAWEPRFYTKIRTSVGNGLEWFVNQPYQWLLRRALRWRYITVSAAVSLFLLAIGWVAGGFLPYVFFPAIEGDIISVAVEMPPGTSAARTEQTMRPIYEAALALEAEFADQRPADAPPLIQHAQLTVGGTPFADMNVGPGASTGVASRDSGLGEVLIELLPGEVRDISAVAVADRWRETIGDVPVARSVEFKSELIHAGEPVAIELRSRGTESLIAAADWLKEELRQIAGVREITDDFQDGEPEIRITGLTPLGHALGLTPSDVFNQVRGAFYGQEAQRIQRGRDEVRVLVRYPPERQQNLADIESLYIRLADGTQAPLSEVATYEIGEGFSAIQRVDGRRVVTVTADLDATQVTSADVNTLLTDQVLPTLETRFPEVTWAFEGEQAQQAESMQSLALGMLVAMVGVYGLLAIQFRSYIQPFIVMSAIPFGIVGAIAGHVVLHSIGRPTPLSFLSMFGVVALSGVVVNDSLILLDLINRRRMEKGAAANNSTTLELLAIECGLRRFRPIFLTTATTFCGLVPIILETSLQAQFIIPMAVSLGFGVLFATAITLLLVPSLYLIIEDLRRLFLPLLGDKIRYISEETIESFDTPHPAPAAV